MYRYNLVYIVSCTDCMINVFPIQIWVTKSQLPGDNVAAGAFENAMRVSDSCCTNTF